MLARARGPTGQTARPAVRPAVSNGALRTLRYHSNTPAETSEVEGQRFGEGGPPVSQRNFRNHAQNVERDQGQQI